MRRFATTGPVPLSVFREAGWQSPTRWPKLDAFVSTIDHWLDEDMKVPRKQRPFDTTKGTLRGSPCTTIIDERMSHKCDVIITLDIERFNALWKC
ncbi:hypothetical protein B2M20_15520 [Nitrobacter vulgaris]|uniref:Uncharacterized protein n=1 Tax=Nitrobacter vulgaris TaxID=29421 RepID=A0A1V4HVC2_NITVU|nr:hypothetical protein B2M20_15520 [Nitrobacter vulgaris]